MPDEDDIKGKVVRLLAGAKPARRRARPVGVVQTARGSNNIQAGGDVHIKTEKIDARPRVMVVPGYTTITEPQKARLQGLLVQWVKLNDLTRRTKLTYQAAQTALRQKGGVSSYHLIRLEDFARVELWLLQQIARLNSSPTARRKSPTWRAGRIGAIQARCNERGFQERRRAYMNERFGVTSMTDLADPDLGLLYSAVMGWRA